MDGLPTGEVTLLFTDIEDSTATWERNASAMRASLVRHDEIVRNSIEDHGGYVFKTIGDAFCSAFSKASHALGAALASQRALFAEDWGDVGQMRVRMALHTGITEERDGDYFGPTVNRVARLLSIGHGGQILLSHATQQLVREDLQPDVTLRFMGERRLKDLFRSEQIFQLVAPDLPSSFPPLKTLDVRLNNLPTQPTSLVGRESEVSEVCALLRSTGVRLLTLTGPGGTGKTRLSLQVAAELLDEYADGVYFVPLAAISDPRLVVSAIAQPLGVSEGGRVPLKAGLKEHLQDKEILLVVDNFEQVLGAASLLSELLTSCPRLKVLVTSRAVLHVYGEREHPVPPLELPDEADLTRLDLLTQYEAVQLFVERAQAVKPDFELTDRNAPATAELCIRLDGLPLALELAAARSKLLTPRAMLDRLDQRFQLLRGGARSLPDRQQTLWGAIDWSYDLLRKEKQTLFERLSVFAGGFKLESAEEICNAEGELDVLDGIESLLSKSLLRREEGSTEEPRFVMLATIREYAREKLSESGEAKRVELAHARYFLTLAEEAEIEIKGPHQLSWFRRLDDEHDNLRAALGWSLEFEEIDLALRISSALGLFWANRGHHSEGIKWMEDALSAGGSADPSLRAKSLYQLGANLDSYGDWAVGKAHSEESLALYRELGEKRGIASVLNSLGLVNLNNGDPEQARILMEEALSLSRELEDRYAMEFALMGLALVAFAQGQLERAEALMEESLASSRSRGDITMIGYSLHNLGYSLALHGKYDRMRTVSEEALEVFRNLGNRQGVCISLINLATAALGVDDAGTARSRAEESLTINRDAGGKVVVIENLEILSAAAGLEEEAVRAARLWGASEALREDAGIPVPPHERALREGYISPSREQLDEASFEEALAEGRGMSPEEAVAYALGQIPQDGLARITTNEQY